MKQTTAGHARVHAPFPPDSRLADFASKAADEYGQVFDDYWQLHEWSVTEPEQFWALVWKYFGVVASVDFDTVLDRHSMPGARWFDGARLNYVDQITRWCDRPGAAVVSIGEDGARAELSWPELKASIASTADSLRRLGVRKGDRVVGYLPNGQEAVIAFLATASLGAIWAGCAPDYGVSAACDRLAQLRPTVLVAVTAYRFAGRVRDRRSEVIEIANRLGVHGVITVPRADVHLDTGSLRGIVHEVWSDVCSRKSARELVTTQVAADHPLWVLFSSGTTGIPKGIVHGHAGIVVTNLAGTGLQVDMGPGDIFFWYTTTNWMLWNSVVSALLSGVTAVTYEGSPFHPSADRLWEIVAGEGVTVFGTSPGHILECEARGIVPRLHHDLSRLDQIMVSGAPAPLSLYRWIADSVAPRLSVVSTSGGTDIAGSFVGGAPALPVTPGEIPGPLLGVAAATYDENGSEVIDTVGELVVTMPTPSMPVRFWDDPEGVRYTDAYFATFPGIWRQGDWATHTNRGSYVVHGRSDSTLNRHGVRIGTADLYQLVEGPDGVAEAVVVGVERANGTYRMAMFVVPHPGRQMDESAVNQLTEKLRREGSPRHVPDEFHVVEALPHTKTGKKLEVPIKRILQGASPTEVLSEGAVDRPDLITFYEALAARWDDEDAELAKRRSNS